MGKALFKSILIGSLLLMTIAVIAHAVPVMRFLAWPATLCAWLWIVHLFVSLARTDLEQAAEPASLTALYSGLIGMLTGLIGALFSLNLAWQAIGTVFADLHIATLAHLAWDDFVTVLQVASGLISVITRPLFGAITGVIYGIILGSRIKPPSAIQ